jgi:hypothetical protein
MGPLGKNPKPKTTTATIHHDGVPSHRLMAKNIESSVGARGNLWNRTETGDGLYCWLPVGRPGPAAAARSGRDRASNHETARKPGTGNQFGSRSTRSSSNETANKQTNKQITRNRIPGGRKLTGRRKLVLSQCRRGRAAGWGGRGRRQRR